MMDVDVLGVDKRSDSSCSICHVLLCLPGEGGLTGPLEQVTTLMTEGEDGQVKMIPIAEALTVIFEAHLKLNRIRMTDFRSSSIFTCSSCGSLLSELYTTYVKLLTLSSINSFFRESIVKESVLWGSSSGDSDPEFIKQEILSDYENEDEDVSQEVVFQSLQINHDIYSSDSDTPHPIKTRRSRQLRSKNPRLQALIQKSREKKIEKDKQRRTKATKAKILTRPRPPIGTRSSSFIPFPCNLCPLTFLTQRKLSRHLTKFHPDNPTLTQCPTCSKTFSSPSKMRRHKQIHEPIRLRPHSCPTPDCSRSFLRRDDLRTHLLTHSNVKMFKCSATDCLAEYKTPRALRHHENSKHGVGGLKDTQTCPVCSMYFPTPSSMKRHVRTVHLGARDFECPHPGCGKKFSAKHMMMVHAEKHKEIEERIIRSYTCTYPECEKSYPHKGGLLRHVKVTHEKKLDFVCDQCGKGFVEGKELRSHKEVHKGRDRERTHLCPHCPKGFMTKGSLKGHVKTQHSSKDQEHLCSECGQAFKAYSSMCRHMACKHSVKVGENQCHVGPFNCHLCGKEFKLKEYLTQHLRSKAHGGTGKQSNLKVRVSSTRGMENLAGPSHEANSSDALNILGHGLHEYTFNPIFRY